jgi:hypothetical protein
MTHQKMLPEVHSSLKPLLIVSHLTGVFICRIDTELARITASKWNKFSVFIFYMIYIIGIFPYSKSNLINQMLFTETSKASAFALIYVDHLMTVSSIVWIFVKREKFFQILVKLSEIDGNLVDLGIKVDYKSGQRKLNFVLLLTLLIQSCLTVLTILGRIYNDTKLDLFAIIYSLMIFINAVALVTHFVVLMSNIGMRFQMMNSCIEKSSLKLPEIHLKIVECVNIFNSIYGLPMMIFFGNLFLWCCILASLSIYVADSDIQMIIGTYLNLILTAIALFMIIYAAEKTLNAKQEIIQLLYAKLTKESENFIAILSFILQIRHTSVAFNCKFFEFNWKFIFKFITACVMYLTIIIQFEKSMEKD